MRNLVAQLLSNGISRRDFVRRLVATGVTTAAANSILESVTALAQTPGAPPVAPDAIRVFQGTGGEAFAEQLIASGVKYVFGNSASEDAAFYEALVDRPQLQYILTPHEGPGAAMAAGYIKASGEPAIVMQAAVVGMPATSMLSFTAKRRPASGPVDAATGASGARCIQTGLSSGSVLATNSLMGPCAPTCIQDGMPDTMQGPCQR